MASKVWFFGEPFLGNLDKALEKLKAGKRFGKGEKIAVKLHMGEYGNLNYIRPPVAGRIASFLKSLGCGVFVFDSLTAYHANRHTKEDYLETARKNGFTKETMGCEVVIGNEGRKVKGKSMEYEVCRELDEADGMVVLSHGKGHIAAGFGGGIKNLGMGGLSRESKWDVHCAAQPEVDREKCVGCGLCTEYCNFGCNEVKNGKISINYKCCYGCGRCVEQCPQNALNPKAGWFGEVLADAAGAVIGTFKKGKILYINYLTDITPLCDCALAPGKKMVKDTGMLASDDPAAIDQASIDLINKAFGENWFSHLKYVSPEKQTEFLEKKGLGSRKYSLEGLNGSPVEA